MDKQTIETAASDFSDKYNYDYHDVSQKGFIAGAEFATPKWIHVSEQLPEKNTKNYGAHVLATNGKHIFTCTYTKGREIEIETESDDRNEYDFDDARELIFLKPGWYELQEQSHHPDCDEAWYSRAPTHWMPLPSLPNPTL
jgi:hypothetical protein